VAVPAPPAARVDNLGLRLRAAFSNDLPRRRAELDAALASDDFEAAGRILHGLRGSATYLAEPALETLCAELEAAADGRDAQRLRAGLPVLASFLDAFETGAPS
jgi:HPt (histidine-containing phosphotransfer) domain-containing protein